MAAYAAHLTRTLQGAPSVFQVTAQEALGATVKPALRKLVEYLAAVYPGRLQWTEKWFDELFLLLDCCLQYHYLKHYAASFSESFYGLVRVPTSPSGEFSSGPRLPVALERGSLALLVLVPYVRDRLERVVTRWRERYEDGASTKSVSDMARVCAVRVHAGVQCAVCACVALQLARYLTGRSPAHSPALYALGLTLRDAPPHHHHHHHHHHQDGTGWADLVRDLAAGRIRSASMSVSVSVSFPTLGGALLRAMEYGAFLVQLLRWWEGAGTRAAHTLPAPPPPQRDAAAVRCMNRCPLCLRTWRVPTVLPVSGYIFCYACIARHVRAERACPVTRCPAGEDRLVRLYVDH